MEFILNKIIFILLFLSIKTQIPANKVLNTCGKKRDYGEPQPSDCVQENEICCYISLITPSGASQKYCQFSPSIIEKSDVEKDIKSYTGYEIVEIKCNKSIFIKSKFWLLILFLYSIF